MPSRDEPFGYVDVEFAWRGAVIVGAQAGGTEPREGPSHRMVGELVGLTCWKPFEGGFHG